MSVGTPPYQTVIHLVFVNVMYVIGSSPDWLATKHHTDSFFSVASSVDDHPTTLVDKKFADGLVMIGNYFRNKLSVLLHLPVP